VIWHGRAEPDTGEPGRVNGIGSDRVLRAPAAGYVESASSIGDAVNQGDEVAVVGGVTVRAQVGGVVRGLVHSSVWVTVGMKIGDIDPRADRDHCFTISDKSLAVGGGVLEAILSSESVSSALHG
jgi:xanthine dehydrogenase accessory factor